MLRKLIVPALCLPLFWMTLGCGGGGGEDPHAPRLKDPDNRAAKQLKRWEVGGGGAPQKKAPGPATKAE